MGKLRVAVQGCSHGELNNIFRELRNCNNENKIDLLILLGDFQSIRGPDDFKSISIPPKYQRMGDFHKYYSGELKAPIPTIFIGGNHESMRHLMSLPYGGYVASNIYYLGYSNVIWYRGIRIGSLSGIWKEWDVDRPRMNLKQLEEINWECNIKNLYHVRKTDLIPLFMIKKPMNLMLSHDWPSDIAYYGDTKSLLKKKPFFKKDVETGNLGSPANWMLLQRIKPTWWLSAHLHVKFEAVVLHEQLIPTTKNNDEIELDLSDEEDEENLSTSPLDHKSVTKFLALDKCLPKRKWLEIIEIEQDLSHPSSDNLHFYWDQEFIENLQYIETNKDNLKAIPFNKLDWDYIISQKHNKSQLSNESLIIPEFTMGMQRQEEQQTRQFKTTFHIS